MRPRTPNTRGDRSPDNSDTGGVEGKSILKRRTRIPLQDVPELHMIENTHISRPSNRRVSFAHSEVKEFRQPADEGTLWGNSYVVDIQKSSSESEHTESSSSDFHTFSSGSCIPGVLYSQQTVIQETIVSYSFDCSEDDKQLPLNESCYVHELVDHGNQTDELVFQQMEESTEFEEGYTEENFLQPVCENIQTKSITLQEWNKENSDREELQNDSMNNHKHFQEPNSNFSSDGDDFERKFLSASRKDNFCNAKDSFTFRESSLSSIPHTHFQEDPIIMESSANNNKYQVTKSSGPMFERKKFKSMETQDIEHQDGKDDIITEADMSLTLTGGHLLKSLPTKCVTEIDDVLDNPSVSHRNEPIQERLIETQNLLWKTENDNCSFEILKKDVENFSNHDFEPSEFPKIVGKSNLCEKLDLDVRNVGEENISLKTVGGRIIGKFSNDCANVSRNVSPTMPEGKVLDYDQGHVNYDDVCESVSPTIAYGRIFQNNASPTVNAGRNDEECIPNIPDVSALRLSPIVSDRVLSNKSFSSHSDFKHLITKNESPRTKGISNDENSYLNFITASEEVEGKNVSRTVDERKFSESDEFSSNSVSSIGNNRFNVSQVVTGERIFEDEAIDSAEGKVRNLSPFGRGQNNTSRIKEISSSASLTKAVDNCNSQTVEKELIFSGDHTLNHNIRSANLNEDSVSQIVEGKILIGDEIPSNHVSGSLNVNDSISQTIAGGKILIEDQAPSNHINSSCNINGIVSQTIGGRKKIN